MKTKGVLFDKDGTLFDFRASWGDWADAFVRRLARDPGHAAQLAGAIGWLPEARTFAPDSVVIAATASDIAACLVPFLPGRRVADLTEEIDAAAAALTMAEAVPLVPLLSGLRARGLRLGVATNDSEVPARAHLATHGLTDLIDFVAGYDSGHGPKPGPGMCLAFAATLGLAPADCIMVGDSRHDLAAGRAAGMACIAVLTGIATEADLAPLADAVLTDIGALPAWLEKRGPGGVEPS
jgi:phosphoglycolate phosphatase